MEEENKILEFLEQNKECYDRFTFDNVMRFLLSEDFDNEEAKDMILFHCSLSALTFQERIFNNYYKKISVQETISEDLRELKNQTFSKRICKN
jgi:hypothetical protein